MKEGAALGIWMICTLFEVYVCSYVQLSSMKVDQAPRLFICLKRLLLRTLDENIAKLCNI